LTFRAEASGAVAEVYFQGNSGIICKSEVFMADIVKKEGCIFCRIANHDIPSIVISENNKVIAVMDINPATPGHILILPKTHIEDIYGMQSDIGSSIMDMAVSVARSIQSQLKPAGLNLIQSNGAAAGQVIFHYHMHLVPRYINDPVVLRFGHTGAPVPGASLEKIAAQIKTGIAT
jgi:histidine triad (HIT) family protein